MTKRLMMSVMMLLLAACGGGNSADNTPQQTSYTDFILFEINNTAESDEPVEINDVVFQFDEDAAQFDSVLI